LTGLVDAVTFLTRVPLGTRTPDGPRMARAVVWFPVVGACVGLAAGGVYFGASRVLPSFVSATLAVGSAVLLTGALHEDGLGDVADAFAGGATRGERLRILKDPRLGTFGMLAIALALLLRVGAAAALTPAHALLALPAAHALSRSASVAAIAVFRPVEDGLGASYSRALTRPRALIGVLAGVAIAAGLLRLAAVPAVLAAGGAVAAIGLLARRKIGGINGDVLGAIQQLSEIAALLVAAAR
jgi:adenosylcobinamide-GDP ribazoletransferase